MQEVFFATIIESQENQKEKQYVFRSQLPQTQRTIDRTKLGQGQAVESRAKEKEEKGRRSDERTTKGRIGLS